MSDIWGADVPISMPDVPRIPAVIHMDGFGFGFGGMVPDITADVREALATPHMVPRRHGAITDGSDRRG